jgi:hypothetical protein
MYVNGDEAHAGGASGQRQLQGEWENAAENTI